MPDTRAPADSPPETAPALPQAVEGAIARLKEEAAERALAMRQLRPLAKDGIYLEPKKLDKALAKLAKAVDPAILERLGLEELLRSLRDYITTAPDRLRRGLGVELKAACEGRGLELRTIRREHPVEVRIPPLALVLDFPRGKGELCFARDPLESCKLDAESILKGYDRALKLLGAMPQPEEFFDLCRRAYLRVLRIDGLAEGERVELVRFLPELAVVMQGRRFRQNPTRSNFKPCSRAQFAYGVLGLRRARLLTRGGFRINFGVATGTTASQKGRAIYLEDDQGNGEYKLTIFFTPGPSEGNG
ncbi:MAG: hypothetical protein ACE5GW_07785 [Planctomycetota bacterium]